MHESALSVCQEALALLRQELTLTMDQINDGSTKAGRACKRVYERCRIEVNAAQGWAFCKRDLIGPEVAALRTPTGMWHLSLPDDCLRVLGVFGGRGRKIEYTVRGRGEAFTFARPLRVSYVENAPDADAWPPQVRNWLVNLVARTLALEITGRQADVKAAAEFCAAAEAAARKWDAQQSYAGASSQWGEVETVEVMLGRRNPLRRRWMW